jgi:hypothetical protein
MPDYAGHEVAPTTTSKSFVVSYAGHLYGPFNSAEEAAKFGKLIFAPWTIIQLRDKLPSGAMGDQWQRQQEL